MGLLENYVASLPDGPRSFPKCRVKQDAFEIIARETEAAAPDAFRALTKEWLPHGGASGWIPEVYANCLTLLFREQVHASDESCLAAFRRNNQTLFEKPLYRVIMFVLSPTLAIMGAEKRWGTFRQGTELRAKNLRKDGPDRRVAEIHLDYPPGLHAPFHLKMIGTGLGSAALAAGARDMTMELQPEPEPGHALWILRYA